MRERYFDYASTTPLDPRVLAEMTPFLGEDFGNPHSTHAPGRKAMAAVDSARERIARLIGAEDPYQVIFTSGSTESNHWVLRSHPCAIISPFEHASVRETARSLAIETLPCANYQLGTNHAPVDLVSVMAVNNEVGCVYDVLEAGVEATYKHSDMTQAIGKIPRTVEGLDYASFNAHKLYGPKGIGALYCASGEIAPMILGGDQESSRRAGTLNVPAIVGFGAAAAIATDERERDYLNASECRALLLDRLANVEDWQVNGGGELSPFILSLSFFAVEGETLALEVDRAGYAISSGAACSARSTEPSHVLTAAGVPTEWARGTVRISFGKYSDLANVKGLGETLITSLNRLRRMGKSDVQSRETL